VFNHKGNTVTDKKLNTPNYSRLLLVG